MHCPICKNIKLNNIYLEHNLSSQHCQQCSGHWISFNAYQTWLDAKGGILLEKPASGTAPEPLTVKRAKLCPQCVHILLKYKLGRGTAITLDHCGQCGGVWFDKHEWAVLKDLNLHDEVYKIFTQSWQKQVRAEMSRENLAHHYETKFGTEDYAKIRQFKAWLIQHPEYAALRAYLNDVDPYI